MPVYSNPDVLGADFLRLVNSPIGSDVQLVVGQDKVVMHAHSLILQARSDYFARALNNDWRESSQGVIHKPNIQPAVFERILQYIYGGRLMLDDDIVMELIKAADELCMEDLLYGCERHALTTICRDNVLELVQLASQHNLGQLKTECLDFIASNIDHLKKGKAILGMDADILKDILSMDQLDLEEIEIWKIAVRWTYFQQGLDWVQCPLLEFPKGNGCVMVETFAEDGTLGVLDQDDMYSLDGMEDGDASDARVPRFGVGYSFGAGQEDVDEDGFRPPAQSVFQRATSHNLVKISSSVHEDLRKQIAPVLSAIRFMRIPSVDFLRLIEGTGLVPVGLCAKVYRYHSVPSMADPYQKSLRRRMAFSTILNKEQKEILLEWLQLALMESRTAAAHASSGAGSSWRRRSYFNNNSNSPPLPTVAASAEQGTTTMATASGSSYFQPSSFSPQASTNRLSSSSLGSRSGRFSSGGVSHHTFNPQQQQQQLQQLQQQYHQQPHQQQQPPQLQQQQIYQQQPSVQSQHPQPKLVLQYRASRDGFDAGNFHMACDQRGPTLTVVRADNGAIFGGYNSSSWSSHPSGVYSTSRVNFLFTLKGGKGTSSGELLSRENVKFEVKGDGNAAAYNKADFGPTFGVGHDLFLASNCNLTCQSSSTMPSSYNGPGASTAALAGSFYFRVQEYEVFLVQTTASSSPSSTSLA